MADKVKLGTHDAAGPRSAVQAGERTAPSITENREDRDSVALAPSRVVQPIAGTVRWKLRRGREPVALGVWGIDFPCEPHFMRDDGSVRPLTRAERRWGKRMARRYRRAPA